MRSRDPKIFAFYVLKVSDVLIHLNLGPYRTKTPEICNLGPDQDQQKMESQTEPDHDQLKYWNLGPDRTTSNKFLKISDQFGLTGPRKNWLWVSRLLLDSSCLTGWFTNIFLLENDRWKFQLELTKYQLEIPFWVIRSFLEKWRIHKKCLLELY